MKKDAPLSAIHDHLLYGDIRNIGKDITPNCELIADKMIIEHVDIFKKAERFSVAKIILQGMVIKGQINDADPMADMCRCWRLADVFLQAGEKIP